VESILPVSEQTLFSCAANGAYDKRRVYAAIPALAKGYGFDPIVQAFTLLAAWKLEERTSRAGLESASHSYKWWKKDSGYYIRSLPETMIYRLRTIFGDNLSAHLLETQTTQALI
jgi:hypothetical protein